MDGAPDFPNRPQPAASRQPSLGRCAEPWNAPGDRHVDARPQREGVLMPHGKPRVGTSKVWGLVPDAVRDELDGFGLRGLASRNQATGGALCAWFEKCWNRVMNRSQAPRALIHAWLAHVVRTR